MAKGLRLCEPGSGFCRFPQMYDVCKREKVSPVSQEMSYIHENHDRIPHMVQNMRRR